MFYVYISIYIYICTYVHRYTYICIYTHTYLSIYIHIQIYFYKHVFKCMCKYECIHMYSKMYNVNTFIFSTTGSMRTMLEFPKCGQSLRGVSYVGQAQSAASANYHL